MHLKMASPKCLLYCFGLHILAMICKDYTENPELSWCRLCHHSWHQMLSWQLGASSEDKIGIMRTFGFQYSKTFLIWLLVTFKYSPVAGCYYHQLYFVKYTAAWICRQVSRCVISNYIIQLSSSSKLPWYSDGLMQERCNSSALALELRLSCTNPLI